MDDILLAGQIANSRSPNDYKIINESLRAEPYGPMIRKDDAQFKALVDKTLTALYKSPEMERIYNKWYMSPIPPKGVNLNFPMTPQLKADFAAPNDKGV
jgi:glutamate/aspartate transport system substrate-binding protein